MNYISCLDSAADFIHNATSATHERRLLNGNHDTDLCVLPVPNDCILLAELDAL